MEVRPSVKPMCDKCRVIKRKGARNDYLKAKNINKDKVSI